MLGDATAATITIISNDVAPGRTPGYWKNHASAWPSAYTTGTLVQNVFTVPACLRTGGNLDLSKPAGPDSLTQALSYKGGNMVKGKAETLLRAAVAALLNEASFGDQFPPYATTAHLISAVNVALDSCNGTTMTNLATQLDSWNNGVY